MSRHIILQPMAKRDIRKAMEWYDGQKPGLGLELLAEINATVRSIQANPKAFPAVSDRVRRAGVKRFPYGVFYSLEANRIVVFACFHDKRDPEAWQKRM